MIFYLINACSYTIIIIFLIYISHRFNYFDKKELQKKNKISIFGGFSIFVLIFFNYLFKDFTLINIYTLSFSFTLLLLGIFDDTKNISPIQRLIIQTIIGSLYLYSLNILFLTETLYINLIIFLFLLVIILSTINAFNFIDGSDGLAAGIFLCSLVNFLIIFNHINVFQDLELIYLLIIISFIYILFNLGLFKYKIYLGNSGSIFLGFLIFSLFMEYLNVKTLIYFPLIFFPLFLIYLNLFFVFIVRIILKRNVFMADNLHIHHLLSLNGCNKYFILFTLNGSFLIGSILNSYIYFNYHQILYYTYNVIFCLVFLSIQLILMQKTNKDFY